jgi:hypothetical protein
MSYEDTIDEVRALSEGRKHLPTIPTVPFQEFVCRPAPAEWDGQYETQLEPLKEKPKRGYVLRNTMAIFREQLVRYHYRLAPKEFSTVDFYEFCRDAVTVPDARKLAANFLASAENIRRVTPSRGRRPARWSFKTSPNPARDGEQTVTTNLTRPSSKLPAPASPAGAAICSQK